MPTVRQKGSVLTKLSIYFAGKRKVLTKHEYMHAGTVPVRMNIITRVFGTYERMVNCLMQDHPYLEGMVEADKAEAPKPAVKKSEEKPASTATTKPKPVKAESKPVVEKKEKKDE